ncbi:MAG: hypothetical protein ACKO3K_06135 [Cuspidothrix sp.]
MNNLNAITLPDNLYQELQKLAEAENDSIESQVVTLLQPTFRTLSCHTGKLRK